MSSDNNENDDGTLSWTQFWEKQAAEKKRQNDEIDAIRKKQADNEAAGNGKCMSCKEKQRDSYPPPPPKPVVEPVPVPSAGAFGSSVKEACGKLKEMSDKCASKCSNLAAKIFDDQRSSNKTEGPDKSAAANAANSRQTSEDSIPKTIKGAGPPGGWFSNQLPGNEKSSLFTTDGKEFTGKYNMVTSENFDQYMKEVGVGYVLRKLGSTSKPVTEISKNDYNVWHIKTITSFKTTDIEFKLGIPFDEQTADGRKCKSTITRVDDKLIHDQKCDRKDYQIVREFKDGEMTMILKAGDVVAKRVYKKS